MNKEKQHNLIEQQQPNIWWIIEREKKIYAAIGNSGNVIYINPEKIS